MNQSRSPEVLQSLKSSELIRMKELSTLTGIRQSTLKFYTERGILLFEQQDTGLTRRFKKGEALKRLKEIGTLQGKGYSIAELKEYYSVKS